MKRMLTLASLVLWQWDHCDHGGLVIFVVAAVVMVVVVEEGLGQEEVEDSQRYAHYYWDLPRPTQTEVYTELLVSSNQRSKRA